MNESEIKFMREAEIESQGLDNEVIDVKSLKDYSDTENMFDEYFISEKEAKPTVSIFEKPKYKGRQLILHKKFIEEE